ncbi:ABC transporter permease subunit [uncultured Roseibium sp.]|uniref:ABC transporter permease n=1 Tax=uncultured Roseibium sp. TaxID=1936171 RepID=UPI00261D1A07|nr:ABC transporter permease subunit [uncultured Roseibium sp.]
MPQSTGRPDIPTVLIVTLLTGPVLAGLMGTILPAFGYLPVLGYHSISPEPLVALLRTPGLMASVALSFGTGLIASILSLAIVLIFTAGWSGTRTFERLTRFLSPLLSVPHAAAAIGLAFLIAPSGFLVRLVSPWATGFERPPDVLILNDPMGITMTLGLVAKEVPFLFLMTLAALNRPHIRDYYKAGASLGYGRMSTFFKLVLPQVYPLIRLPMLAVIAYATSVVDVAQILGPTTPAPLAPRLVAWMNDPDLTKRLMASAGALLQLLVSALALLVYLVLERLVSAWQAARFASGHRRRRDGFARLAGLLPMVLIVALMTASIGLLGIWTVAKSWWFPAALPQRWSFERMLDAFGVGGHALFATLAIAVLAAGIATALTLWLLEARSYRKLSARSRVNTIVFLPLLMPQISFLFGLQMLFLLGGLSGTFEAVLLAHLIFVFPYAYLALSDPWHRLDPRYAKAAASVGASRMRIFWQIQLPLLLRPVLVTFAVAAAVSVGQYLPTLMIGAGRIVTVTTESVALASGGNRQVAALYALLQLVIPLAGFILAALVPSLAFRNRAAMRLER